MTETWALGLAWLAGELGRDLQRPARVAGGARALWRTTPTALGRALGAEGEVLATALRARSAFDAHAEREALARADIRHVARGEPAYPARLAQIHDPPFGLFARGADADGVLARVAEGPTVALVGSRRATAAGLRLAHDLAGELARRGAVIVSGLAYGIDAAAHEGALAAGGLTVAVLGSGVDAPYPRRNAPLAERIAGSGLLVSEYWPGTSPAPWRFPARNRIVAGMAQAAGVVEAGRRSGALITADFALELGRPVLAVPGWPGAASSEGANALLRAGAGLLEEAEDVVAELPEAPWRAAPGGSAPMPVGLAAHLYELLRTEPLRADGLVERTGAEAAAVAGALALLEVDGLVVRGEGQRFWAAPRAGGRGRRGIPGSGVHGAVAGRGE